MKLNKPISGAAVAALLLFAGTAACQGTPIPTSLASADASGGQGPGDAVSGATQSVDAGSSATPSGSSGRFLGFRDKESFHRFSGWMSGGVLLAAGVVGAVHAFSMMSEAHQWRDDHDIHQFGSPECTNEIEHVWNEPGEQALRWTHVGLLAVGETFYFANAFTGLSFMGPLPPGWSKAKIHRYAFFAHAALMATECVLGFMTSDALRRGDHGEMMGLLEAHTAIGFAIPVIILGSGAIMSNKKDGP
jgi:hypothetical protein